MSQQHRKAGASSRVVVPPADSYDAVGSSGPFHLPKGYLEHYGIQLKRDGATQDAAVVHEAADQGMKGSGEMLPHRVRIQQAFGEHDVSGVRAFVGGPAADASARMGASAYAVGNQVAFASPSPDLHTAAHEAAHVVQQRTGVHLKGGVGEAGDTYEQQADAVADRVVAGRSAEDLLGAAMSSGTGVAVQRRALEWEGDPFAVQFKEKVIQLVKRDHGGDHEAAFNKYAHTPETGMTKNELLALIKTAGVVETAPNKDLASDQWADGAVERLDKNGDGKVQLSEFLAGLGIGPVSTGGKHQVTTAATTATIKTAERATGDWPLPATYGDGLLFVVSGFLRNGDNEFKAGDNHGGVDLVYRKEDATWASANGAPVSATHDGEVTRIDPSWGAVHLIRDDRQMGTTYGHMKDITVKSRQKVTKGQAIGLVGSTGAEGSHLHYEIFKGDTRPIGTDRANPIFDDEDGMVKDQFASDLKVKNTNLKNTALYDPFVPEGKK